MQKDKTLFECYYNDESVAIISIGNNNSLKKFIEKYIGKEIVSTSTPNSILKEGMIVETKNGKLFLYISSSFYNIYDGGFSYFPIRFDDNLCYSKDSSYNVEKIYKIKTNESSPLLNFKENNLESIWQRENEFKEYTISELEEIVGTKIKIVNQK